MSEIGIVALECYFPLQYVSQSALEKHNNESCGKYTKGLGQTKMSFCADCEDINSIALTCVSNLLSKYDICGKDIGRLTVSTETPFDHSKSIKSVLMQLFNNGGDININSQSDDDNNCKNTYDIEGCDMIHACYSGTAALFDALNWCHSPYWNGKYAIVVCGDIAEYSYGNARATGGAGCISLLIGNNGIIQLSKLDGLSKASYSTNDWDFYKANFDSPYPIVDGHKSNKCYLTALDNCYQLFKTKFKQNVCMTLYTCMYVVACRYVSLASRCVSPQSCHDNRVTIGSD